MGAPKGNKHARKYKPAMDGRAKLLAAAGFTDEELAAFFGLKNVKTIQRWKKRFPTFYESLSTGKAMADTRVEAALYQRAIGYSCPDVHVSNYEGEITLTPIIKHYPPDTTAQIFWLKNRKPEQWRDKHEFDEQHNITVKVVRY